MVEHSMKSSALLNVDPSPPTSTSCLPDIIHVLSVPWVSPFFTALPLMCIILNTKRRTKTNKQKKLGRHGNKAA